MLTKDKFFYSFVFVDTIKYWKTILIKDFPL